MIRQVTTTIGIDLAAQPRETACCVLEWRATSAHVLRLERDADNSAIAAMVQSYEPAKVAIDSPFGWPIEFVQAVHDFTSSRRWPDTDDRRPLLFRTTDRVVSGLTGADPLSVSANLLGICAMRCARLLTLLAAGDGIDRTGGGLVAEVYPAAALRQWGLDARGYKGSKPEKRWKRDRLVEQIVEGTEHWLMLDAATVARLRDSDHFLDALIAAIIGRAVAIGRTLPIPPEHAQVADAEGWIHLPPQQPLGSFMPLAAP